MRAAWPDGGIGCVRVCLGEFIGCVRVCLGEFIGC